MSPSATRNSKALQLTVVTFGAGLQLSVSRTKVMKLASISLIAAALATIAGNAAAAPAALRPAEKNSFECHGVDVDIYSRGLRSNPAGHAIERCELATKLAREAGQVELAEHHENFIPMLEHLKNEAHTKEDLDLIKRRRRAANNTIARFTPPARQTTYTIPWKQ